MDFEQGDSTTEPTFKDKILQFIEFVVVVGAILMIVRFLIAEPHRVDGNSMVPNFHTGDYILTNKLATRLSTPARGNVIILTDPLDSSKVFIKRVIGLPGEMIMIQNGQVLINDQVLPEPYLPRELKTPGGSFLKESMPFQIPKDHYFVIGDNRLGSSDSREWGPLKKELIIGQALIRYWPVNKFTILKTGVPSI